MSTTSTDRTMRLLAEQCTGRGARGVVAAAAPVAAAIGAEMLRAGGNAYDAAVAAALAETVLLPPKCGLAGDLVAISIRAGRRAPEALLAIGGAPRGLAAAVNDGRFAVTGACSVGVPAAPAGYLALASRARLSLGRLASPAITLAREGFVWAAICTRLAQESRALVERENPQGTVYFPGGDPIRPGEVVRLDGLARALEELVARGPGFLEGPVGAAVLSAVRSRGGVMTRDDFSYASAQWCDAASMHVEGWTLWATPHPTHGPSLLDAMAACRRDEPRGATWDRVMAAIARRRDALVDQTGTSMVSAADSEGNVVVVVHSNSFPRFGSGIVVGEFDLILSNRAGRGFTPLVGHPNFPTGGRRPSTTLHAWAAGGEEPEMFGATPGGVNQMPWNAQLLTQLIGGERDPGALVTAPRWEWLPDAGTARVESNLTDGERLALASRAGVEVVDAFELRCAQQVVVRPRRGSGVIAAVDPRTGGAVVGA